MKQYDIKDVEKKTKAIRMSVSEILRKIKEDGELTIRELADELLVPDAKVAKMLYGDIDFKVEELISLFFTFGYNVSIVLTKGDKTKTI